MTGNLSGQLEQQRTLATEFIVQGSYKDYVALKETYDPEAWRLIYPEIVQMLEGKHGVGDIYPRIPGSRRGSWTTC